MLRTRADPTTLLGPVRRTPAWLAVPVLLALVVRVVFVTVQSRYHVFDIAFDASDSELYRSLAQELLHHGRYAIDGTPTAWVSPGYPMLLAALAVVSTSTVFIGLVQAVLGAITVGFLASTANRIAGNRAA
ncbi:MAG: hypothetical protein JWN67_2483 [Actinomycetia bacterium]|nr:hypothetical protein [Actinomycetes bacterium]